MTKIGESELILNSDGSIFHLHLKPENIADTILLVGDMERVSTISSFFDTIEFKIQNREFVTHTGLYKGKRITALSTGIGTDNIDIVINELDSLVNIDLQNRIPFATHKTLNFIRIGTSGSLQPEIEIETPVISEVSGGLDGLLNFYADRNNVCDLNLEYHFKENVGWDANLASPYFVEADIELLNKFSTIKHTRGITLSAPGFYGPQGRVVRLPIIDAQINEKLQYFRFQNKKITNYEMESSAIYGLSKLLGHKALTICLIIANRNAKKFSKNYKPAMQKLIEEVLNTI